MRKIESGEEIERKRQKRAKYLTFFLLFILVASTAGYAFTSSSESSDNGESGETGIEGAQNIGGKWIVNLGNQVLTFSSSPESVKNIPIQIDVYFDYYANKPLYIQSNSSLVTQEIASSLGRYALRVQNACYGECNNSEFPEKICSDNLIIYDIKNENRIYQQENCIFIEGDIRAVDAFLYRIFNIN